MKVKSESEVAQSCLTCSDPKDCSLPGSSVHGIFQARVLEWGAIAFSDIPRGAATKKKGKKRYLGYSKSKLQAMLFLEYILHYAKQREKENVPVFQNN